ncbi:hypothetical protein Aduo_007658 [Ancylostoma duodenale]
MGCKNGHTFLKALGNDLFENTDVLVDIKSDPLIRNTSTYPTDAYAKYHDAVSSMREETEQMHTKTLMWPATLTDNKYRAAKTILTRAAPYLAELKGKLDKLLPILKSEQKAIFDNISVEVGKIEAFLVKEIVANEDVDSRRKTGGQETDMDDAKEQTDRGKPPKSEKSRMRSSPVDDDSTPLLKDAPASPS